MPAGADSVQNQEAATVIVTEADGGASFSLRRGDHLIVQLSGSFKDDYSAYIEYWEPESSDEAVLQRTSVGTRPDGGAEASFVARASGDAGVSYSSHSECPPPSGLACPDVVATDRIDVTVVE